MRGIGQSPLRRSARGARSSFRSVVQELLQLNAEGLSVLELGFGPGFLARHLLESSPSLKYVAIDFSPAMHTLAKEHLGALADRVQFLEAIQSFRLERRACYL